MSKNHYNINNDQMNEKFNNFKGNTNNITQSIEPYYEALSFFTKFSTISKQFSKKYKENNTNPNLPEEYNSIDQFIQEFKEKKNIKDYKGDEFYIKNPHKLYYFFLRELHKIFKSKSEDDDEDNLIEGPVELDVKRALNKFKKSIQKDNSEISDLFFGEKLIKKKCFNCNLENYKYLYLKFIYIDLSKIEKMVKIEELLEKLQIDGKKTLFCEFCQREQKFAYSIKIIKYPEIMVIIFYNHHKNVIVDFPLYIKNNEYQLICASVKEYNYNKSIFDKIINICKKKIDYKLLFDKNNKDFHFEENEKINILDKNSIKNQIPYVLFYKKVQEKKVKKNSDLYDLSENNLMTQQRENLNDLENINNNNEKKTEIEDLQSKDNFIKNKNNVSNNSIFKNSINRSMNKNINNNNNINTNNNINNINNINKSINNIEICLYFQIIENMKEFYIEVNENEIFENIIKKLIMKYKNYNPDIENMINNSKFMFNNIEISDFSKSAKELKLFNKCYIHVGKK